MFKDIVGQKEYVEALKLAIDNNRLPHALLISGNEGTGGLALAFAAAQYLMCPERIAASSQGNVIEDSCGECSQCIQLSKLQHPDLHFVYPVVKLKDKDTISTDLLKEWREAFLNNQYITLNEWVASFGEENKQAQIFVSEANNIIKELSTKPYESDYRVMIIWLPEKLREDAANKLLKIIEEPYENTHFILVSNDPEHIIGTIQSRVQRLNLPPIKDEDIRDVVISKYNCSPEEAQDYARMSHGSFVEALKLISDDVERRFFFEKFCAMMRLSYLRKLFDMKAWSEEIASIGRERQKAYLQYAQQMIRENFIMNVGNEDLNYMNNDERTFSSKFHAFVNDKNVFGIVEELSNAEKDISQNVNSKMVFFDLSLKLIMLLKSANN